MRVPAFCSSNGDQQACPALSGCGHVGHQPHSQGGMLRASHVKSHEGLLPTVSPQTPCPIWGVEGCGWCAINQNTVEMGQTSREAGWR